MSNNKFNDMVNDYIELDNIERDSMDELKQLRANKKRLQQEIMHYLKVNDIHTVNIPGGTLKYCVSKRKSPAKKDIIKENLLQSGALRNPGAVDEVVEYIYGNTPMVESEYLKRTGRAKNDKSTTAVL